MFFGSDLNVLFILGTVAGVLQFLGYWLYLRNDDIDPNPVTWFMFAYGTALLTILEWDKEATFSELILPLVCSVLAIVVSYRCWRKARQLNPHKWWPEDWWPEDLFERGSFVSDIIITIGYVAAWILSISALLSEEGRGVAVFMFLFLSNLSTFPSFYPIFRSTYQHPEREHWLPWAVWTLAYAVLGYVTYTTHGEFWQILMFYPASNVFLHGLVSLLALRRYRTHQPDLHEATRPLE